MYREKIDAYIDSKKDEMIEDLKTLVRIDSQCDRRFRDAGEGAGYSGAS